MDRILRVLLVEDDADACRRFDAEIEGIDNMTLVAVTNSSTDALRLTQDYLPDAVILDLELTNGEGNGLDYLFNLKSISLSSFPYIVVTTNNSSPTTYEFMCEAGIGFLFSKHQTDYSEKKVVNFINMVRSSIFKKQCPVNPEAPLSEIPAERTQRLKRAIAAELNLVGINPKKVGYQYLVECIFCIIEGESSPVTDKVAKNLRKTKPALERAMQNAIQRAWYTMDINDLLNHYKAQVNPERGVPTLTEFMYYYADKIKSEHI